MSSVSSIAASGMAAATMRLQMSANKVANAANQNVDLADEIVQQLMARVSFAANAQVIRADSKMMASLLDITA
jgi:flagellar basal-body rod protein FlgC